MLDALDRPHDLGEQFESIEEALDADEEELAREEACQESDDLGVFDEEEYAAQLEGWEFKLEHRDIGETYIEVYYRRPWDSPGGTKWERLGHERSPNALELKRLLHCAQRRDKRESGEREKAEAAAQRRRAIEEVFGSEARPLLDALFHQKAPDGATPPAPLTPRQEAFCRHYLAQPSGTRAAITAGYAESGAAVEANRLLRNAKILAKISALRRERALTYALDRDTMLDKLEWVFDEAMQAKSHSAALRALLAQAELSGLLRRRHAAAERAEAKAREIDAAHADAPDAMSANDEKR
jgi:hypothetical protein